MHIRATISLLLVSLSSVLLAETLTVELLPCAYRGDNVGVVASNLLHCSVRKFRMAGYTCADDVCQSGRSECIGKGDLFDWAEMRLEASGACADLEGVHYEPKVYNQDDDDHYLRVQVVDRWEGPVSGHRCLFSVQEGFLQ
ncbi:hypothetical protein BG015_011244 [Linnemannia schmuckeri]|uniref:Secreted protein n=1 Tax=Linnemannia schmuckeri TaxID=64567 RepID=A0A9P5V809_9FUNG|nr:hypothetical protein BG015_011244 [Linnemannia schmuckeri]